MASLVKDLIDSGIHFGHRSTNWNPKMAPYIYGKKNKIHVIDVKETIKGLLLARKFLSRIVSQGKDVLFIGTKRQARACIEQHVQETGMHYVVERWLGGTLTNFRTIRDRLKRLEELESLEESGKIGTYSKKMEANLRREKEKILRNLGGIRHMNKLPGAMVIIDAKREINAIKEARKLKIPTVCLIDTDSNPDHADIAIPGNDDAMRSIEIVVDYLCRAINEGKTQRPIDQVKKGEEPEGEEGGRGGRRGEGRGRGDRGGERGGDRGDSGRRRRRRGSRTQFRADETGSPDKPSTPSEEPTKMGPAAAEGDTDKAVTSPVGQDDAKAADRQSPPQEPKG